MLGVELTVMQNAATSDMERAYEVCPISPCRRAQVSGPYRDGPVPIRSSHRKQIRRVHVFVACLSSQESCLPPLHDQQSPRVGWKGGHGEDGMRRTPRYCWSTLFTCEAVKQRTMIGCSNLVSVLVYDGAAPKGGGSLQKCLLVKPSHSSTAPSSILLRKMEYPDRIVG